MLTRLTSLLATIAVFAVFASRASATGPWSVRLRATYLETVDKSDAFSALGVSFGANAVKVSDRTIPEIDIVYSFTETWTTELVLTLPQEHSVVLRPVGRLGTFKHLPPTLLFQYRALPDRAVRPYVGLGVNYTLIWDDNLAVAGVPLGLESSSVGLAGQVGVDWTLNDRFALNIDLKRAVIRSDVSAGAAKLTEARLDPWLYSVGIKYQF